MSASIDPNERKFSELLSEIRACSAAPQVRLILDGLNDKELGRFASWLVSVGLAAQTVSTMIGGIQLARSRAATKGQAGFFR